MATKKIKEKSKANPDYKEKSGLIKNLHWLYAIILVIIFVPTYLSIFDAKIAKVGDNAGYYIFGKSLAQGDGYKNIHDIDKTPGTHFPPGYPAIIAGVMKVAGPSIEAQKNFNGFLLIASLIILFFFFRKISMNIHLSFIITLLLVFNAHLLQYSTWMMSEISFLFFTSLALFLFAHIDETKNPLKNLYFIGFLLALGVSYYIRSQGIAILAAASLFFLIKLNWKYLISSILAFVAMALPWQIRGSNLPEGAHIKALTLKNYYKPEEGEATFGDIITRITSNLERYFGKELSSGMFGNVEDYQVATTGMDIFLGIVIIAFVILGIIKLKEYKWLVVGYLAASFGILMLWPDIWYGIRFMLAVVPLLLFLFFNGIYQLVLIPIQRMKLKSDMLSKVILPLSIILLLPSFYGDLDELKKEAKQPTDAMFKNYFNMAKWSQGNLPKESVIIARKPKLFYLYADRYVTVLPKKSDFNEFLERLAIKKVSHFVFYADGQYQSYFMPIYQATPEKFKVIQQLKNPDMYMIEYHPEWGYQGTWQENKMHGQGSYVYPDGRQFEGTWENGVKKGKGVLKDQNGNIIQQGIWENDQLIGQGE